MDKIGKGGCRASPCFIPGFKAKRISLRPWQSTGGDPKAAFRYGSLTGTLSIWSISSHICREAVFDRGQGLE
jgi:hypothetical protein